MGFFEGLCLEEGVITEKKKSGIENLTTWLKIGGNFLSFIYFLIYSYGVPLL